MNLQISRRDMIIDINDYLTGLLEAWTCGLAEPFDISLNYVLFNDWKNLKGETIKLVVPGTVFMEAWRNCGTMVLPTFFETIPSPTFIERLWKKIKGIA